MSTAEYPILIAAYEDESHVFRALQKLRMASFRDEQIGVFMHSGKLLPTSIIDDLIDIGVPEEQAVMCERALQAGHTIVLVRHEGRVQEAFLSLFEITITGVSVSQQKQSQDQAGTAAQTTPYGTSTGEATASKDGAMTPGEEQSLWSLLNGAGLGHLL